MNKIDYLPKFYDKSEVKSRQKQLVALRKELIATNKLTQKEVEMLNDLNIELCADTFSRNYELHKINDLIGFVQCR